MENQNKSKYKVVHVVQRYKWMRQDIKTNIEYGLCNLTNTVICSKSKQNNKYKQETFIELFIKIKTNVCVRLIDSLKQLATTDIDSTDIN